MPTKLDEFKKAQKKTDIPSIRTGNTVRVTEKVSGKTQAFEGLVIAKKHGQGDSATITVRKVVDKVGVEKVFPLHSPSIEKIEVVKDERARKSKIYYIREKPKKIARKKLKNRTKNI